MALNFYNDITKSIGNTPLIKLKKISDETGCTILGKAEFMNPFGSIKDRAALSIIQSAISSGSLKKNGIVVEGTAGNTGIGISHVCNALGYRALIVMPDNQSQEKKDAIKLTGAELKEVPPAPYSDQNNYIHVSKRIAEDLNRSESGSAFWANQFDNIANRDAHYEFTGPEIWKQTDGKIDAFICSVGTGGTIGGVSRFLKEKNPNLTIGIADPFGASLFSYYTTGELKSEGNSISEGIGQSRITTNLEHTQIDVAFRISDSEMLTEIFSLMEDEGICVGGSSGINIMGAKKLAKKLGPGKTIVTILCDYGSRYQSKIFNPEFLKDKGLPIPKWMD